MILICPTCRAPSNTNEARCWVCHRDFDGSEPVIGDVPGARKPHRLSDLQEFEARVAVDDAPWRKARTG